ncbi:MAG TPA: BON domain-containing protein [Burkholderiales bacterium]|nr:BON domain-containing protein [Burkholderiales bacterium]
MKTLLFSIGVALVVGACGRQEPADQAKVEETRQVEQAAEKAKPLSSTSLTQIVKEALQSESSLDARRIDVENRDGAVALHGRVENEEQKEKAGRIVSSVGGVKSVDNRLTIDDTASTGSSAEPPKLPAPSGG